MHYAVIRLDPETMVKDLGLDDPTTLTEVAKMSTRKHLVYLWSVSRSCIIADRHEYLTSVRLSSPSDWSATDGHAISYDSSAPRWDPQPLASNSGTGVPIAP